MRRALAVACLRALTAAMAVLVSGACALVAYSYSLPLPEVLRAKETPGQRIYDRQGLLLARRRGEGDVWREPLLARDLGKHTIPILLAAEDARFWSHPGVDPVAMARAAWQFLLGGHVVSGASTITQQLARTCFDRPRTVLGKLQEIALALRIERTLGKEEILVAYLNRAPFGPNVLGMAAASERYLGKPIAALDLGETALLLATVRGPTLYDLGRHVERARLRRDRILERAAWRGLVPADDVALALGTPAALRPQPPFPGAFHFARKLARESPQQLELRSTIDWQLQRRAEDLARRQHEALVRAGASAVAIVVLSNPRAEIVAYVGSHEPTSQKDLGQNDGAASLRQPGSALKPFLYAAAIDRLGYRPDTILPDEPLTFRTPSGHYAPDNFDRRFRGPVSLSRALSSSLNVPAVFVLERLGVTRGLETLRHFGLTSLDRDAEHYGLGLALGAGEVSLLELTAAYSALARGGAYLAPRAVLDSAPAAAVEVVSPEAAHAVTGILEDPGARSELFAGLRLNHLGTVLPFALKTGTSTGFRDAWAFVYDDELTVGVWVGNFDGRPMVKTSGAVGAAPLAVEVLVEARALASKPPVAPVALDRSPSLVAETADVAWSRAPRITFPAEGARLSLRHLDRPSEIVLRAADAPSDARLLVDGRAVPWQGKTAVIVAEVGRHQARLVDRGGAELSAVTFQVSL